MAQTLYAFTDIRYGKPGGGVVEFAAGDVVIGLPKDVMKRFVEVGAIATYDRTAVIEEVSLDDLDFNGEDDEDEDDTSVGDPETDS